ncbi:MAG: hypothetical protein HC831_11810, partial [Chloroflexia bacterium]|nr:hypothetical protein [Chloroflexia bacterium]
KLVALSSFGKGRTTIGEKNGDWELLRNCSLREHNVIGGFSKMFKYFKTHYPGSVYSFADLDWTNPASSSYEKNGFKLVRQTSPTYFG